MRATFSPSVTFTGVRVPKDTALGEPGAGLRVGVVESFALGYAAVYLGIAEARPRLRRDYAKKRVVKPENVPVANDPAVQRHIGELSRRTSTARCSCWHDSAERWEAGRRRAQRGLLGQQGQVPRHGGRARTSPRR